MYIDVRHLCGGLSYLEKHFEKFQTSSVDELIQHAVEAGVRIEMLPCVSSVSLSLSQYLG